MHHQIIRETNVKLSPNGMIRQRREFLRHVSAVGLAAGTLGWSDLMALNAAELRRRGKACILLWMQGGPSQFETFSPKAGESAGGETKAISTSVAGIQIAEHLPKVARQMDDICLIRSMTSKEGSHPRATYLLHTGYLPMANVRHPALGAIAAHQLSDLSAELPSYVRIGGRGRGTVGGGLLGVEYDPLNISDPNRPPDNSELRTDRRRFRRRMGLLSRLEKAVPAHAQRQVTKDHQKQYASASRMMLSPEMKTFDLQREPESLRHAYGESSFAAGCVMARRLVEAGVTFVEVALNGWDTHDNNAERTKDLCGTIDQPYAQLLSDLRQRGLLDSTLVLWMGEFGRTPRINARGGRDHYPRAFNVGLAGCGVRGGQVIGATDDSGAEVTDRPVTVPDLFQTVCHLLEIDADAEHVTSSGRPIKIVTDGEVVNEVVG